MRFYRACTVAILVLATSCAVFAQTKRRPIPGNQLRSTPPRREPMKFSSPVFDNRRVKVMRVELPAGGSTQVPADIHDYVIVALDDAAINLNGGPSSFDLDLKNGEMNVIPGRWAHKISNRGGAARLLLVEVTGEIEPNRAKCGLAAENCREVRFGRTAEGDYSQATLFDTEKVKMMRAELGPSGALRLHDDNASHLVVGLTPLRGSTEAQEVALNAGEVFWSDYGFQELSNNGNETAKFLVMELK